VTKSERFTDIYEDVLLVFQSYGWM